MRRALLLLALPVLALLTGGARPAPNVSTPAETLQRLKWAVARSDRAGEWATLSPGFKLRLNQQAGRNVDVGDYTTVREAQRNNPRIRKLEQYLPSARITGVWYDGRGGARVTIRFGGPLFFGASAQVGMIHHAIWELWIHGESTPYWGFMGSKQMEVFSHPDRSVTVRSRDPQGKVTWEETFPAGRVRAYQQTTRWYFNDFGAMESEFVSMAGR
jgi:hypothetical protein